MPADTRALISALVQENGAGPDEVTWGPHDGVTAEEEDWMDLDENEEPLDASHEGGEYADSVRILIPEITTARYVLDGLGPIHYLFIPTLVGVLEEHPPVLEHDASGLWP